MKVTVFALAMLLSSAAHAQSFKVVKVKGNKAVIELPKGITLEKGERYTIDAEKSGESAAEVTSEDTGSRARVVGGEADLFVGSTNRKTPTRSTSESGMQFSIAGKFGWNTGQLEYGPLLALAYESDSDSKNRTIAIGGFFDYNFTPNTFGVETIYGLGAMLSVGQIATETSASRTTTDSSTILSFFAGPFAKWFVFGHSTCLRGDLGLRYSSLSEDSTTTTTTGLGGSVGFETYF
jgi:hypothetical protein